MNAEDETMPQAGMLSSTDIMNAINSGEIHIFPFDKRALTGIGYNLSPTDFFLSVRKGVLEKIHVQGKERFIYIDPNDTVLTLTQEYVELNNCYAGTFHSKVKRVSQGFGHISTTLDPLWKGQLLISVNNPTGKKIKYDLTEKGSLCTLLLYRLISPANDLDGKIVHDNDKGRVEIILNYISHPPGFLRYFQSKAYKTLKDYIENDLAKSLTSIIFTESNEMVKKLIDYRQNILHMRASITEGQKKLGEHGKYLFSPILLAATKSYFVFPLSSSASKLLNDGISVEELQDEDHIKKIIKQLDYLVNHFSMEINNQQQLIRIQHQSQEVQHLLQNHGNPTLGSKIKRYAWKIVITFILLCVVGICFWLHINQAVQVVIAFAAVVVAIWKT